MTLLVNRWKTPDGTFLQSKHRHDFVSYTDTNGLNYFVDGGLDYSRISFHQEAPLQDCCLYATDLHEEIRKYLCWGTRGKDAEKPLKYVPICNLSTDHIEVMLESMQDIISEKVYEVMKNEVQYRKQSTTKKPSTLKQFAELAGVEIVTCPEDCYGGKYGYRTKPFPDSAVCGYKTQKQVYEGWLDAEFEPILANAIRALFNK